MRALLVLTLALGFPGIVLSAEKIHWQDRDIMSDAVYLRYHPDQRLRGEGIEAYGRGDYAAAMNHFKEAARFADKASQAFIASMYWEGRGVARDPAIAYAWIDVAAERGYTSLLAYRELYWSQMDEATRKRALGLGVELRDEYGDRVTKKRLERLMLQGRSRAAVTNSPYLYVNGHLNWYSSKFWMPRDYWVFQEVLIKEAMPHLDRAGKVEIGPLQPVRDTPTPDTPASVAPSAEKPSTP